MIHSNRDLKYRLAALVLALALLLAGCGSTNINFGDDPGGDVTVADVIENLRQTVQGWVDTLDAAVDQIAANAPLALERAAGEVETLVAMLVERAVPVARNLIAGVNRELSQLLGGEIPVTGSEPEPQAIPDGLSVQVDFIDVGQGDAILVRSSEGKVALIDGGEPGSGVLETLQAEGIGHIHLLVLTHPHSDHLGGLIEVLRGLPVDQIDQVITSGQPHTTDLYLDFLDAVTTSKADYLEVQRGDRLDFGSLSFQVLNPPEGADLAPGADGDSEEGGSLNDNSLVLRLDVGQVGFLFTGDAGVQAESEMLAAGLPLRAEVLKLGHHGSSYSTSPDFLAAVDPSVAVYSAGADNEYGHPHQSVLDALRAAQVQVYGTDSGGTITVTTDGVSYQVAAERETEGQP